MKLFFRETKVYIFPIYSEIKLNFFFQHVEKYLFSLLMVMVCVHVRVCVVRGSLDPQLPNYKCYSHWNLLTKGDMGSPSPVRFETKKEKKRNIWRGVNWWDSLPNFWLYLWLIKKGLLICKFFMCLIYSWSNLLTFSYEN